MELILKYFPRLTEKQKEQFAALYDLYTDWNSKINVISRKDITNLYEHHVLHSLGIAKVINFTPGTEEKDKFDFVVSRAVMPLGDLIKIIRKNISQEQHNALPNGLICLKGGELGQETMPVKHKTVIYDLKEEFDEDFFETKKVVYVTING